MKSIILALIAIFNSVGTITLSGGTYKTGCLHPTEADQIVYSNDMGDIMISKHVDGKLIDLRSRRVEPNEIMLILRDLRILALSTDSAKILYSIYDIDLNTVVSSLETNLQINFLTKVHLYQAKYHDDDEFFIGGNHLMIGALDSVTNLFSVKKTSAINCAVPLEYTTNQKAKNESIIIGLCNEVSVNILSADTLETYQSILVSTANSSVKMSTFGYNDLSFLIGSGSSALKFDYNQEAKTAYLMYTYSNTSFTFLGFQGFESTNFCIGFVRAISSESYKIMLFRSLSSRSFSLVEEAEEVETSAFSFFTHLPLVDSSNGVFYSFFRGGAEFEINSLPGPIYQCAEKFGLNDGFKCLYCNDSTSNNCTQCTTNYSIIEGSCWKDCKQQFYNFDKDICQQCEEFCDECNAQGCLTCVNAYELDSAREHCQITCQNDEFRESRLECRKCPEYCLTCNNQNSCLEYKTDPITYIPDSLDYLAKVGKDPIVTIKFTSGAIQFNITELPQINEILPKIFKISYDSKVSGDDLSDTDSIEFNIDLEKGDSSMLRVRVQFKDYSSSGKYKLKIEPALFFLRETTPQIILEKSVKYVEVLKLRSSNPETVETAKAVASTMKEVDSYASTTTNAMAIAGVLLAVDPTGIVIKFVMVIKMIGRLQLINVYFGDVAEIVLNLLGDWNGKISKEEMKSIRINEIGYKGKLSDQTMPLSLPDLVMIYATLYILSFFFLQVSNIWKMREMKKMKIGLISYWTLILLERFHFTLYCLVINELTFYGIRIILHKKGVDLLKGFCIICIIILTIDSLTILRCFLQIQDISSKKSNIDVQLETMKKKNLRKERMRRVNKFPETISLSNQQVYSSSRRIVSREVSRKEGKKIWKFH